MSLVRFYVAELKTRDREVESLRAELGHVRKTRREAMERAWAAAFSRYATRGEYESPERVHIMADHLDAIERELDAREEN